VFRNATPLKRPGHGRKVLGYEAQYLGKPPNWSQRVVQPSCAPATARKCHVVPATIDIIRAEEEMRVGDRLLPEPPRQLLQLRAARAGVGGRRPHRLGLRQRRAAGGQSQVVAINRGPPTASRTATCWPS
jgi:hypothetical protein